MKDFNDLYKSYMKSIIKEDPDEDLANNDDPELKELQAKWVGKTLVKMTLKYHPADEKSKFKWDVVEYTIHSIKPIWDGTYNLTIGADSNHFFKSLEELKEFLATFDNPTVLEINKIKDSWRKWLWSLCH